MVVDLLVAAVNFVHCGNDVILKGSDERLCENRLSSRLKVRTQTEKQYGHFISQTVTIIGKVAHPIWHAKA